MKKVKYVLTRGLFGELKIIVFPNLFAHKDFESFNPISAGFIDFGVKDGKPFCHCYGESIGLGLKSNSKEDTELAMEQLGLS
jgi:hypothetical protein